MKKLFILCAGCAVLTAPATAKDLESTLKTKVQDKYAQEESKKNEPVVYAEADFAVVLGYSNYRRNAAEKSSARKIQNEILELTVLYKDITSSGAAVSAADRETLDAQTEKLAALLLRQQTKYPNAQAARLSPHFKRMMPRLLTAGTLQDALAVMLQNGRLDAPLF